MVNRFTSGSWLPQLIRAATLLVAALLLLGPADVFACPVCHTETGQQVRAGIFDENFGRNIALTLLPFPFLFAIVAVIHFGWGRLAAPVPGQGNFDPKETT